MAYQLKLKDWGNDLSSLSLSPGQIDLDVN